MYDKFYSPLRRPSDRVTKFVSNLHILHCTQAFSTLLYDMHTGYIASWSMSTAFFVFQFFFVQTLYGVELLMVIITLDPLKELCLFVVTAAVLIFFAICHQRSVLASRNANERKTNCLLR